MDNVQDTKELDTEATAIAGALSTQVGTPPAADFSYFITDPEFLDGHLQSVSEPVDKFVSKLYSRNHAVAARPIEQGMLFVGLERFWFALSPVEERNVTTVTALVLIVDNFSHNQMLQSFPFTLSEITTLLPYRGYAYSDFADVSGHERFIVILPLASPVTPREHFKLRAWARSRLGRDGVRCLEPHIPIHFPCSSPTALMSGTEWKQDLDGPLLSMLVVPSDFVGPAYVAPVVPTVPPSAVMRALRDGQLGQWMLRHPDKVTPNIVHGAATNFARVAAGDSSQEEAAGRALAMLIPESLGLDANAEIAQAVRQRTVAKWSDLQLFPMPRHDTTSPYDDACLHAEDSEANPERYLLDLSSNKFIVRSSLEDGEEVTIAPEAMKMIIGKEVLPKLVQEQLWKIPWFHRRAPIYNKRDLLVQTGHMVTLNTYVRSKIRPDKGDWSAIRALLIHLVGKERSEAGAAFLIDWLAMPLQYLYRNGVPLKLLTAIVLRGEQGTGKGLLKQIMRHIYGATNVGVINQKVLDGDFNTIIQNKLLLVAEEVKSDTAKYAETKEKLKGWITEPEVLIEGKGIDIKERKSCFNMMFFSNRERPVDVEQGDRRFSVFSQEEKLPEKVIEDVVADIEGDCRQVSAFMYELLHREVTISKRELFHSQARDAVREAGLTLEQRFAREVALNGIDGYADDWVKIQPLMDPKFRKIRVTNDDTKDTEPYVTASAISGAFEAWANSEGQQLRSNPSMKEIASALRKAIPGAEPLKNPIKVAGARTRVWRGLPANPPTSADEHSEHDDLSDFKLPGRRIAPTRR